MKPACFNSEQEWEDWCRYADASTTGKRGVRCHFCTDCTPEYQDKMVKENRCAHPDVKFIKMHGVIIGRRARRT